MHSTLALVGYALAAAGYLLLGALLMVGQRGRTVNGRLFVTALLVHSACSAVACVTLLREDFPRGIWNASEAIRSMVWTAFFVRLSLRPRSAPAEPGGMPRRFGVRSDTRTLIFILVPIIVVAAVANVIVREGPGEYAMLVVLDAAGVVATEQFLRRVEPHRKWAVNYLCLAVMAMMLFDVLLYGLAIAFDGLNSGWTAARGFVSLMVLPLLAVSATRNRRDWLVDVGLSRRLVFHTTLLMAGLAGGILATGTAWYVRRLDSDWGDVASAATMFWLLLIVAVVLMSATIRSRIRLALARNFFRYRFDYREHWLGITQLLSGSGPYASMTDSDAEVRAIIALAQLVESPGGVIWLADHRGVMRYATRWRYPGKVADIQASEPLLQYLAKADKVVTLPLPLDSNRYRGVSLPDSINNGEPNWLIVPLSVGRKPVGMILLLKPTPTPSVNWETREVLLTAAQQVASFVSERTAVEELIESRQFDSFNRMTAFVVHDLKNLVQQMDMVSQSAYRHKDNPQFQADMLATVRSATARMKAMLMQLSPAHLSTDTQERVDLTAALLGAIDSFAGSASRPSLTIDPAFGQAHVHADPERISRVIRHLVQNALDACGPTGHVVVRASRRGGDALIEVQDNGPGMTTEFIRHRLFKPFNTTKPDGMGLGSFECHEYAHEIGGSLEVVSQLGQGTTFRMRLPLTNFLAVDVLH